ncbi:IS1096 element passenger TnpR family protein [Reyranella sp.]|uniref:IS1096 element passenger TnpR family protein n=1 Tax=Reyranella sp. TaxID=1929291 RepID=UPI003D0EAAFD
MAIRRASMAGAPERRAPADGTTHLLRASLKPKLYRDVEIDSMASLAALAEAITGAFEFDFDHAYGFYSTLTGRYHDSPEKFELFADIEGGDSDADSVQETAVSKAFSKAGKKMLFLFDYGDEWRFTVELIKLGEKMPGTRYPRLVGTSGDAPEQYPDMDED